MDEAVNEATVEALSIEQRKGAWKVPDVEFGIILPVQFGGIYGGGKAASGVQRLMLAVLEDAIRCWQGDVWVTHRAAARKHLRSRAAHEAEQWLFECDDNGPFSYRTICETLEIDAEWLRKGMREFAAKHGQIARSYHRTGKVTATLRPNRARRLRPVPGKVAGEQVRRYAPQHDVS